jgi:toxin ParE1/3/4
LLQFLLNVKRLDIKASARRDLAEIRDFSIERFGGKVAAVYLAGFRAAFRRILEFPEMGSVIPDAKVVTHLYVYRSHRIFYRVDKDAVLIVRVIHHSRDVVEI